MGDIAIKVEDLGKRYRIGEREPYRALRDVLAGAFAARLRRLGLGRRSAAPGPGTAAGPSARAERFIWALKGVSFEVTRGEVVGIIGRNGAGKSTLLKILSRITRPTEGRAEVHGLVGSLLEVGTGFHPELTGRENIFLNGAILGMKKAEIDGRFAEIVAFAEVEKFIDMPVKHYSSGMYMRLAFAVAAHLEPDILLVDEVLAVGDAQFQKKCVGKMGEVAKEGRTVLFVSHNMAAVEQLCSRAICLADGRVERTGNVEEVIRFYLSSNEWRQRGEGGALARSADGAVELLSVGAVDEEGGPLLSAQCGRDLNLSMLLRTRRPLPRVTVSIGLNNLYDTRVAVLHSGIAGCDLSLLPGTHSVVCRVSDFPLSAGGYVMDVKVISGHEVVLWAPRVEQLMVEAGDFYNTGRLPDPSWGGFCHLRQRWEARRE